MSFVLAEYIMTKKPRNGLGTEDLTICRLKFIFLDLLVYIVTREILIQRQGIVYCDDITAMTCYCSHAPNGESHLAR